MFEFISNLFQLSMDLSPLVYLSLVFILHFVENLFPPVPGDTFLVFVTYVFITAGYGITGLFVVSLIASVAGFMSIYVIGKHWGRNYFYEKDLRWMPVVFLNRVEIKFRKYGQWVIFFNRFMPGMRSVIGLFSGISHIKWPNTLLLVTLSTMAWNTLLITMGYYLGENWSQIEGIMRDYNLTIAAIFAIMLLIWFIRRSLNLKEIRKGEK